MQFETIPQHSANVMLAIGGLLSIATLIQSVICQGHQQAKYHELSARILSWWWMIGVLFGVFVWGKTATIVFFAIISFLALKEFLSIIPVRQADRNVIFWAYLSIPLQYYWVADAWYGMFIIFIPVYMFLLIPMRMVIKGETSGFIKSAGVLHWAVMLTVFSVSHLAYLMVLPQANSLAGGIGLILYVLFLTQFNDVSQYVWGKSFGRHKIIAKVSPNKTWEGFIGGFLTIVIIAGFLAPYLTPLSYAQGLIAGVIISFGGFFGDVVMSSVKRDLKIKDCGCLIPGHGGILDRMDSLIYTAPLFFHYLYYLS